MSSLQPSYPLGTCAPNVGAALLRVYLPTRLHREPGTLGRIIADREADLDRHGWCVLASRHDSLYGYPVAARRLADGSLLLSAGAQPPSPQHSLDAIVRK